MLTYITHEYAITYFLLMENDSSLVIESYKLDFMVQCL